jgi:hypothetical protein
MNITVFILTRGRVGKQHTLQAICQNSTYHPVLVHPASERHDYDHCVIGPENGVQLVRQFILGVCDTPGMLVFDDDLRFYERYKNTTSLVKCTNLDPMFHWVENALDEYWHGGISPRQGNNHMEEDQIVGRVVHSHFLRRQVMQLHVGYDPQQSVMEDYDFTLQMLTRGYPNIIAHRWCAQQIRPNAEGGCSLYRTDEVQKRGALLLAEKYPRYVKAVEKKGWKNMESRLDVRVQWLKAYKEAINASHQA